MNLKATMLLGLDLRERLGKYHLQPTDFPAEHIQAFLRGELMLVIFDRSASHRQVFFTPATTRPLEELYKSE